MFGLGAPELLVIGGIILLLFGPAKIPALAASVGKGIREFKKGVKEPIEEAAREITAEPERIASK